MRKQVMVEQKICDVCGSGNNVFYTCARCGKDFCYEHKAEVIECEPGVYHTGHGSSEYCIECYGFLVHNPTPLFLAYQEIEKLRIELTGFYTHFETRRKIAEDNLIQLYEKQEADHD